MTICQRRTVTGHSEKQKAKPDFLLVGATKSGTTSVFNYLREHPDVYMPALKEPRFFIKSVINDMNEQDPRSDFFKKTSVLRYNKYIKLFDQISEEKAIGEASPQYLYNYQAAIPAIKSCLGDVKIIIILRNPIHRAFSAYQHLVRDRYETLSFQSALDAEVTRRNNRWSHSYCYMDVGLYYRQVKAYLEHFTQVKIMLFDDLRNDIGSFVEELYRFLDVDSSYLPNVKARYNMSGIPKNNFLHHFLHRDNVLRKMLKPIAKLCLPGHRIAVYRSNLTKNNLSKLQMDKYTFERLKQFYEKEMFKLQHLIGRDLSAWLQWKNEGIGTVPMQKQSIGVQG